jgi:predicted  nucleic acid-binding Zn-ribbon protein
MTHEERIKHLEAEVQKLKEREKTLMHDLSIYNQVFSQLKLQFEQMKKELLKK